MTVFRTLAYLFSSAVAAALAAGPLLLGFALLPVGPWAVAYCLAMLAVVAAYRWWRAATDRDAALGEVWELRVREQELAQRLDTRWDDDLCALIDFEENR